MPEVEGPLRAVTAEDAGGDGSSVAAWRYVRHFLDGKLRKLLRHLDAVLAPRQAPG